jgi:hypothetical protein
VGDSATLFPSLSLQPRGVKEGLWNGGVELGDGLLRERALVEVSIPSRFDRRLRCAAEANGKQNDIKTSKK